MSSNVKLDNRRPVSSQITKAPSAKKPALIHSQGESHRNGENQCWFFCGRGFLYLRRNRAAVIELNIATHLVSPVENVYRCASAACDDGVEYLYSLSARYCLVTNVTVSCS